MSTTCLPSRSVTRRCWPLPTSTARPVLGGITFSNAIFIEGSPVHRSGGSILVGTARYRQGRLTTIALGWASSVDLDLDRGARLVGRARCDRQIAAFLRYRVRDDLTDRAERIDDRGARGIGSEGRQWLERATAIRLSRE